MKFCQITAAVLFAILCCTTLSFSQPITVIAPNGGETFSIGDSMRIRWAATASISGAVMVQLSTNNGQTWITISGAIAYGNTQYYTGNAGLFTWGITDSVNGGAGKVATISTNCRIRVQAPYDPNMPYEFSDTSFTIKKQDTVATPAISPASGSFYDSVRVTLTCDSADAIIYYTTDGSAPSASSVQYSAPFKLISSCTIKAVGIKTGHRNSSVAQSTYTISPRPIVATPAISPASGSYNDSVRVTLVCDTVGATIYYTTDGTAPDTTKTLYSVPFKLTSTATVKAVALKSGLTTSSVAQAVFMIGTGPVVATPVISPASGSFFDSVRVTITCDTAGATMYYTTDGTTPSALSTLYSASFKLTTSCMVNAIGVKTGLNNSSTAQVNYTVTPRPIVATPLISPASGSLSDSVRVTITCDTAGATIYYTIDETTPNALSNQYTGPFKLTSTSTVRAVGIKAGLVNSSIAQATYTIGTGPIVATPVISPAAGPYLDSVRVAITCDTAGATIYYTTDGTTPTASSIAYSTSFKLISTCTVQAVGIKSGLLTSSTAQAIYTITPNTVAQVTIEPNGGNHNDSVRISLTCATTGATIYFAVDGTDPIQGSSPIYYSPFWIKNSCTLKARAFKTGLISSSISSAPITIDRVATTIPASFYTIQTTALQWQPIGFSYTLADQNPVSVFSELGGYSASAWKLFVWKAGNWKEYAVSDPDFLLKPGTVVWLITGTTKTIQAKIGLSTGGDSVWNVTVPSHDWADFTLPFTFADGVLFSAITSATGATMNNSVVYTYINNGFVPVTNLTTLQIPSTSVCQMQYNYSIYNKNISPMTLVIPSHRNDGLTKTAGPQTAASATGGSWSVQITLSDKNNSQTILSIGNRANQPGVAKATKDYYPAPYLPGGIRAYFAQDPAASYQHCYTNTANWKGTEEPFSISNPGSEQQTITLNAQEEYPLPAGAQFRIWDCVASRWIAPDSLYSFELAPGKQRAFVLVAGPLEYLAKSSVQKPLSVVCSATRSDILFSINSPVYKNLQVSMYDIAGRFFYKASLYGQTKIPLKNLSLKNSNGFIIVKFAVLDNNSQPVLTGSRSLAVMQQN